MIWFIAGLACIFAGKLIHINNNFADMTNQDLKLVQITPENVIEILNEMNLLNYSDVTDPFLDIPRKFTKENNIVAVDWNAQRSNGRIEIYNIDKPNDILFLIQKLVYIQKYLNCD